ncbi:MAG: CapA family protein [bacterium]
MPRRYIRLVIAFAVILVSGILLSRSNKIEAPSSSLKTAPPAVSTSIASGTALSEATTSVKILFGGDIFLDRAIRRTIDARGKDYLWSEITPLLKNYPHIVANLEGPILDKPEASANSSFSFAFRKEDIAELKTIGFTDLSLANNHTLNEGTNGLINTRNALKESGINYFGDSGNAADKSYIKEEWDGQKIALIGDHDLVPQGKSEIINQIQKLHSEDYFVIAYPHWGIEYATTIPAIERERAHELIDAGADLIIGSHPHVIQPIELYKGRIIFYSLGNLLFDQYFSFGTMHGLLVGLEIDKNELKFTLYPMEQDRTYKIHMADNILKNDILKRTANSSNVPQEMQKNIQAGAFTIPRGIK